MPAGGVPGLRSGDRPGPTVPDLDAATRFFVDVLGVQESTSSASSRPRTTDGDSSGSGHRCQDRQSSVLRSGADLDFGLCQHTAADQVKVQHRNSDAGGIHLALYVDDFEAALTHLIAHGVQLMREPTVRTTAPSPDLGLPLGSWEHPPGTSSDIPAGLRTAHAQTPVGSAEPEHLRQ